MDDNIILIGEGVSVGSGHGIAFGTSVILPHCSCGKVAIKSCDECSTKFCVECFGPKDDFCGRCTTTVGMGGPHNTIDFLGGLITIVQEKCSVCEEKKAIIKSEEVGVCVRCMFDAAMYVKTLKESKATVDSLIESKKKNKV